MCDRHGKSKALAPYSKVNYGSRADLTLPRLCLLIGCWTTRLNENPRPSNIILYGDDAAWGSFTTSWRRTARPPRAIPNMSVHTAG